MFRFAIRDLLWLMIVVGLAILLLSERLLHLREQGRLQQRIEVLQRLTWEQKPIRFIPSHIELMRSPPIIGEENVGEMTVLEQYLRFSREEAAKTEN